MNRVMSSAYMQWAKLHSASRFNLAVSGMPSYPLSELPVKLEDLELSRGGAYGYAPLQARLAAHCGVEKENVVTAAGTSMANLLALAAILEPGDQALVEHPTYELLLAALGYLQADIRRFERTPESGFALDPRAIERAITTRTKVIVLTNLHNPSSALADQATLRAVGEIARGVGARVLVDEVYLDAVFDDTPPTAFQLGPQFVVTNSLTKVYGLSGLRCGWILAEPGLARRIWQLDDLFDVNPAHVAERLSCLALANLGPICARSRALLDANRPLLNQFFATRSDLEVHPLESGTVAFPRLLSGTVDRLCDLLRSKYEATVVPGSFFEMPDHFRIGIATETPVLVEGLHRLASALDSL
ncbi:MAG: aminotransferase class I/II-fold pyridoxal phosphate-dependent enzyme [Acidobacteriota bacterium]|nr:aminotransferase class I/II-fold pyridoxal phosphate-dependent enzyme [Acidobacteriota bacterium]